MGLNLGLGLGFARNLPASVLGYWTQAQLETVATSAGRTSVETLKVPGVDTLPTGAAFASNRITITGNDVTLTDWDIRAVKLLVTGDRATVSQCLFSDTSGFTCDIDGADCTISNCKFGPFTTANNTAAMNLNGNTATITSCWFTRCPVDMIKDRGKGATVQYCYFNSPDFSTTISAYNAGTTYSIGDPVSSGGTLYYSETDSNTGNTPPNATYWTVFAPHIDIVTITTTTAPTTYYRNYFNADAGNCNQLIRLAGVDVALDELTIENNLFVTDQGATKINIPFYWDVSGTYTAPTAGDGWLYFKNNYLTLGNSGSFMAGFSEVYPDAFWLDNFQSYSPFGSFATPGSFITGPPGTAPIVATYSTPQSTKSPDQVVSFPVHTTGELLILAMGATGSNPADSPPDLTASGWTQAGTIRSSTAASGRRATIYSKVAASGSEALTIADDPNARIVAVGNLGSSYSTVTLLATSTNNTGATTQNIDSGTTTAERKILYCIASDVGSTADPISGTPVNADLSSITVPLNVSQDAGGGTILGLSIVDATTDVTGAASTLDVTFSASSRFAAVAVALT